MYNPHRTNPTPESIGRGGLVLPAVRWRSAGHAQANFVRFFQELWKVNQVPVDPYSRSRDYRRPDPVHAQIAVPASEIFPLVIIETSFKPKNSKLIETEEHRNIEDQDRGRWPSVCSGVEKHSILSLPEVAGPLVTLIHVELEHHIGGSAHNGEHRIKENDAKLTWLGVEQKVDDSVFDPSSVSIDGASSVARLEFAEDMKQLMQQTVQLLTD